MNQYPKLMREEIWEALIRDKVTSAFKMLLLLILLGVILYERGWQNFLNAAGILFCLTANFILLKDGYIFIKRIRSPSNMDIMFFSVIAVVNLLVFLRLWPLWMLYIFIWLLPCIPYMVICIFARTRTPAK